MEENNANLNNANTGADTESAGANDTGINDNPVTFDDFLKDGKNQAEFDKRVQKAINTAKANWEEIMNSEKTETEKLAKMNKEQKLEYQAQKERIDKEKALAELNAYKLKEQATKIASDKGLDISLLTFFNFETVKAEEINSKIEEVSNAFNKAVEKAVNERLKEDTPTQKLGIDNERSKSIARASY
jgi:monoamine oxidase